MYDLIKILVLIKTGVFMVTLATLFPAPVPSLSPRLTACLRDAAIMTTNGRPVVVTFDEDRSLYAQFCPGDKEGDIHGELVGPGFLAPEDQFSSTHLDLLMSLGWTLSDGESEGLPNHFKIWETEWTDLEQVADEVIRLACHIFRNDGVHASIDLIQE